MLSPLFVMTLLAALAAIVFVCVKRIPEGTVYTLRRLGGQPRTLHSGTHLVLPLFERVVHRIALTGRSLALDERVIADGRAEPLRLRGTVYWQVLDAERADALIEHADELLRTRALNAIRAVESPQLEATETRNLRLKAACSSRASSSRSAERTGPNGLGECDGAHTTQTLDFVAPHSDTSRSRGGLTGRGSEETMDRDRLQARLDHGLAQLGMDLPPAARTTLLDYVDLLERWNGAYNLTAVRDPLDMVTRHLLDSLAIAPYVRGETLADLGSGAGLPGLPLAIIAPERRVTVVDSNGKKTRFLRTAVRALKLANVDVVEARVEKLDGRYDCVTARAFASLADMLGWGGRLLADGGQWLAMKGRIDDDEFAALPDGFGVDAVHTLNVPGLDAQRHLVVLTRRDPE
jgi:16S rRNA (guanine527-N7)-methyltransferase